MQDVLLAPHTPVFNLNDEEHYANAASTYLSISRISAVFAQMDQARVAFDVLQAVHKY